MPFIKYAKTAFINRWHLLVGGGLMGLAMLSGAPDVFVPLVLAGEAAYLGLLASHPKFQAYVNAQEAKSNREQNTQSADQTLRTILRSLPAKSVDRFEALRTRCIELRQIATAIKDPSLTESPLLLEQSHLSGLDRLLWIYLRMLFTQYSLERFLQKTSAAQIQQDITRLEERLGKAQQMPDEIQRGKFVKTIEDNLQTCRDRLANYEKARANEELIRLEIDRLENKIRSLSELAVNRQEPDFISTQVDQVASSMLQTERTMNELQFATGLAAADEQVPTLVRVEAH
jgi:chemotaxis protein histidine kinase CheA